MDKRLEKVKILLGINDNEQDELLLFVLEAVEKRVLSYINRDTLPEGLEEALLLITVSYFKSSNLGDSQEATGPVASVSRGNVSTSFAVSAGASGSAQTFNLGAGDDFFGWRNVLNEYRKLRW